MATKHAKKPVRRAKAPVTKRPTVAPLSLDDVRAVAREELKLTLDAQGRTQPAHESATEEATRPLSELRYADGAVAAFYGAATSLAYRRPDGTLCFYRAETGWTVAVGDNCDEWRWRPLMPARAPVPLDLAPGRAAGATWHPISAAPRNKWLLVSGGPARNPGAFAWQIAKVTDESLNNSPPYAICWGGGSYMGVKWYMELPEPPGDGMDARGQPVRAS